MEKHWWQEDWSEEITIFAIFAIAGIAMVTLKVESSNIVSMAIGGLIGYLKRSEPK